MSIYLNLVMAKIVRYVGIVVTAKTEIAVVSFTIAVKPVAMRVSRVSFGVASIKITTH